MSNKYSLKLLPKKGWSIIKSPFILLILARDLAKAINELQDLGIFHNDLELRNIIMTGLDLNYPIDDIKI